MFLLSEFFSPIRSNSGVFSVCYPESHQFRFIHSQLSAIILQILPVHLLIIHLPLYISSRVLKISRRFVFPLSIRSSSFEVVTKFKPFNSTGAFSLKSFYGVSFEWALTHRYFPRILPDSSYFIEAIFKFISKFDVRMIYHQSNVFLQDLSNSFHRWLNLSNFFIPECLNNSWWCFSSSFLDFEDRRRVFPPYLIRSLKDS